MHVAEGYDEAVVRTRAALRSRGVSILTEMHVGDYLRPAGEEGRQYLIMGAYGGSLATGRVGQELDMAVHLPCNVVIDEEREGAVVAVLDPGDDAGDSVPPKALECARLTLAGALEEIAGRLT
ncbi:hypothetical protein BH18ACT15_BH18ACT15_12320 [soil metagenome]